jgi:DNA-binding LytR/AlgR family response regulator
LISASKKKDEILLINLNRVRSLTPRSSRDWDLRLDPPVNRRIPIGRNRLEKIRGILAV